MCCVHNIILGKLWIEQYGAVEIINHRYSYWFFAQSLKLCGPPSVDHSSLTSPEFLSTGEKCLLNFKPCGMFGRDLHKVEGYIQDRRWEPEHISSVTSQTDGSLSQLTAVVQPVRRSGASSMESGQSACTASSRSFTKHTRSQRRRPAATQRSWNRWDGLQAEDCCLRVSHVTETVSSPSTITQWH